MNLNINVACVTFNIDIKIKPLELKVSMDNITRYQNYRKNHRMEWEFFNKP